MKEYATIGHVMAQKTRLLSLLEGLTDRQDVQHCVLTRLTDDTNIWIQASRNAQQDKMKGKLGNKKVTSVLGMCERLTLRTSSSGLRTLQLVAPAQVLPKAGSKKFEPTSDLEMDKQSRSMALLTIDVL